MSLEREFAFRNSKQTWMGVPIIAANMDTTGTHEMCSALSQHHMVRQLSCRQGRGKSINFGGGFGGGIVKGVKGALVGMTRPEHDAQLAANRWWKPRRSGLMRPSWSTLT